MIELPEATVIAEQISQTLRGKRIKLATRGNTSHKFAFYSRTPEEYASILAGKTIGQARAQGSLVRVGIEPGYVLILGGGGERILYHAAAGSLPAKHQLFLHFDDETFFTVTVQGWGAVQLFEPREAAGRVCGEDKGLPPTDPGFTLDYFDGLFTQLPPDDPRSVKYFIISRPGIQGIGNGYLQDILFNARLHPRRPAAELSAAQRRALFKAITGTISGALKLRGRDDEHDLFDRPGGYQRTLSADAVGKACPRCATPIVKASYLGGAIYWCPKCQEEPAGAKTKPKQRQLA